MVFNPVQKQFNDFSKKARKINRNFNLNIVYSIMDLTSGYPYWLIKSGLPANYPKLESNLKTDVLIIGGGISGALSAWHLCEAGIECTVVDGRTIGLGSTSASTSLLQYELDTSLSVLSRIIGNKKATRAYNLCYSAIDKLIAISKKLQFTEIEKRHSLYFAAQEKDTKLLELEYKARSNAGLKVDLLNKRDIKKEYGFSAPAAILSSQGATTNAYMFTHALLQQGLKKGLSVFDRTKITSKKYSNTGITLHTEQGHIIRAKKVINATGYEVTEFLNKNIIELKSTYALISENMQSPTPPWKDGTMLWNTADPYLYIRITSDNRIIVGGRDEDFYDPAARDKLIKRKTKLLAKDFSKLFPSINMIPEYSWIGTFGSTKDSLPYIGGYNKTPNTYYSLGFGGNGIVFSLIAAEIICDMIKGKKNENAELFSFDR